MAARYFWDEIGDMPLALHRDFSVYCRTKNFNELVGIRLYEWMFDLWLRPTRI